MNEPSGLNQAVSKLASRFAGQLLGPGDPQYVDKRPALIARCRGVPDITDAVSLAREQRLEIAGRGGGHSIAGRTSVDDGMMIVLSLMKGIHAGDRGWPLAD